jgi:hypothetical protein
MMGRRLLLLVAVLMGITALAASVAPRQSGPTDPPPPPGRTGTATPAPTPELGPAAPQTEDVLQETLSAAPGASSTRVLARPGQTLQLEVQGALFDEVILEGLDRMEAIAPEAPARFELYIDRAGRFPIRLREADRQLGEIVVRE